MKCANCGGCVMKTRASSGWSPTKNSDWRCSGGCQGKLLSPARKRHAVVMLQDKYGVTERFACQAVHQHRSTQRLTLRSPTNEEKQLRQALRKISDTWPRYGYRMAWRKLRQRGHAVNRK